MNECRTHVGRELTMMLAGEKPLAMFYVDADAEHDERVVPEQEFANHVRNGRFVTSQLVFEAAIDPRTKKPLRIKYVLYALPSEQWRLESMRLALETLFTMGGADEGLDRMMGSLLGHTAEEIEVFVRNHRSQYRSFALRHYDEVQGSDKRL